MRFDLIDDPWIPVIDGDERIRAGIRQALLESHRFTGLAPDAPMQEPAILRQVLLPVMLAALGPCRDHDTWADRFEQPDGFSPAERTKIENYLDRHRNRFDLFSATAPFAQVARLQATSGQAKSAALLIAKLPSGNNVPLFAATTEADQVELTPAEAVCWLLNTLCWDTAAIKTGAVGDDKVKGGKTTGNPTGPLGRLGLTYPVGSTLYDTLQLNAPIAPIRKGDVPVWEREPATAQWNPRPATGILDLFTWPSRRVRLIPQQGIDGIGVSQVVVAAGDRMLAVPEFEPHTLWRREAKPKAGEPTWRPRRHRPGQTAWQGLAALLAVDPGNDEVATSGMLTQLARLRVDECIDVAYPLQIRTVAVEYGVQSAVIEDIAIDQIPLPVAALLTDTQVRYEVLQIAEQAGRLARAVDRLGADLRRACGGQPLPWDSGEHPGDRLLYALNVPVRRVLAGIQCHADDAEAIAAGVRAWQQVARAAALRVGTELLDAAPPEAFAGRTIAPKPRPGKASVAKTYRSSTAEAGFRREINKTLPLAAPPTKEEEEP
ncbi:type I-E CRISPR-associated protein Cse1/CasA [Catenulispora sp. NL8]|uniref:Type I-E CRISPR-associated protein Cse1/CasA n=1 Tax=Catenulispora pinistramenti TaxID=2705254 RepID=A0ABS5KGJ8_9ACTN|nr:type I-E CRISPR-associated protein Cse1/CasA [Catenulispora pinistramenti]MBS2545349.1 type I-E CRISPR-associated protein Cse1/CasA [Catenulispora pinistramenti]